MSVISFCCEFVLFFFLFTVFEFPLYLSWYSKRLRYGIDIVLHLYTLIFSIIQHPIGCLRIDVCCVVFSRHPFAVVGRTHPCARQLWIDVGVLPSLPQLEPFVWTLSSIHWSHAQLHHTWSCPSPHRTLPDIPNNWLPRQRICRIVDGWTAGQSDPRAVCACRDRPTCFLSYNLKENGVYWTEGTILMNTIMSSARERAREVHKHETFVSCFCIVIDIWSAIAQIELSFFFINVITTNNVNQIFHRLSAQLQVINAYFD